MRKQQKRIQKINRLSIYFRKLEKEQIKSKISMGGTNCIINQYNEKMGEIKGKCETTNKIDKFLDRVR